MIYIDAENLQDGLYNIKNGKIYKYKTKGGTARVYKLENRPQGEWIGNNLDGTFKVWDCSECGIHMETRWNFCPNCGADMRKGKNDE